MKFGYFIFFSVLFLFGISCVNAGGVSSGVYVIRSSLDNEKVLTTADNNNIQINSFEQKNNQYWQVIKQDDGSFIIESLVDNSLVFDVTFASIKNETNVRIYSNNGTAAQKWKLKSAGEGYYYIVSLLSDKMVLDIAQGSIAEGTNGQLYTINYSAAQNLNLMKLMKGKKLLKMELM